MCGQATLVVEARVTRVRSERAYDLEMVNGHRFVGFVKKHDLQKKTVEVNQRVNVRLSSFDLSKGQIVFEN